MTEIKQISCKMVNTYLLKGKNGAVLVDTGETADQEKVLKACENANVRLLVLTHAASRTDRDASKRCGTDPESVCAGHGEYGIIWKNPCGSF